MYDSYIRCCHWGKLSDGYWNLPINFAISCESIIISKNKSKEGSRLNLAGT
uniref:Uncharacterized protein n=1 Tax=Monodon monoceros TaxID=40151 RepID=A0A8C6B801_MONMO